jgi:hypothetical protein
VKIESPAFTLEDVHDFMDTYLDRERNLLADRLQQASDRLAAIGPRVQAERGDKEDWNAQELLAHLAVLSKFYGVLVHRISTGTPPDLDLLQAVQLRDSAGDQMARLEPQELVRMTLADHERTIKTLRSADPKALRQSADLGNGITMTAEEVARLPLISHLEMHIDQLEKMLGR